MKVKLWGVRGSLPTPQHPEQIESRIAEVLERFDSERHEHVDAKSFLKTVPQVLKAGFGGNTACVEVFDRTGETEHRLIIDAGSGLRVLGEKLMGEGYGSKPNVSHLLFTHFHWDHLIGLPFFSPVFMKNQTVHLYAVQEDLEFCVRSLFKKPFFPVPFEALGAKLVFHVLKPRTKIEIDGFSVTPYELDHPDPCWGYRIERGGRVYAHCVDTEAHRVSRADMGLDAALYENANLVLFDAQYTMVEAAEKMNWGHSAGPIGLEIALRENVQRILFAHHDPGASDEKIVDAERQTRAYLEAYTEQQKRAGNATPTVQWSFAREGEELPV
jgi:phosphoribosyl 1,2-cyclic phosphodiesterase